MFCNFSEIRVFNLASQNDWHKNEVIENGLHRSNCSAIFAVESLDRTLVNHVAWALRDQLFIAERFQHTL